MLDSYDNNVSTKFDNLKVSHEANRELGVENKAYLNAVISHVSALVLKPSGKVTSLDTPNINDGIQGNESDASQNNEKEKTNKKENQTGTQSGSKSIHESSEHYDFVENISTKELLPYEKIKSNDPYNGLSDKEIRGSNTEKNTYMQTTTFDVDIGGRNYTDLVNTYYRIALRDKSSVVLQPNQISQHCFPISQRITMNRILASDFATFAKRYTTYTADHSVMDLAGLIEQLSAMVAVYSAVGTLSWKEATLGLVPRIAALQQHSVTQIPSNHCIFIPAGTYNRDEPNVMSAIIAAATATRSTIVTDVLSTDGSGREAHMVQCSDYNLAHGAYQALSIIGANYEACDAGDVFALAYTRGVHRVLSVVGHTDEGSIMRTVLRTNTYEIPYGGISIGGERYNGIPEPISPRIESYRCLIDSIALVTAALVAECDPGVVLNGRLMPICYGSDSKDADKWASDHQNSLRCDMGNFALLYVKGLNHIFNINGNSGLAKRVLTSAVSTSYFTKERHLRYKTLSPFYWIEPTGIIVSPIPGVSQRSPYFGAYTYGGENEFNNPFMIDGDIGTSYGNVYEYTTSYGNLRAHPFLLWCSMRAQDGLANVKIANTDIHSFCNLGPNISVSEFDGLADIDSLHLGRLRWRSGDCIAPKPTEAMYVGHGMKLLFKHIHWGGMISQLHNSSVLNVPSPDQIRTMRMRISVSKCFSVGLSNSGNNYARRVRETNKAYRLIDAHLKGMSLGMSSVIPSVFTPGDVMFVPPPRLHAATQSREDVKQGIVKTENVSGYGARLQDKVTLSTVPADTFHTVPEVQKNPGRQTVLGTSTAKHDFAFKHLPPIDETVERPIVQPPKIVMVDPNAPSDKPEGTPQ